MHKINTAKKIGKKSDSALERETHELPKAYPKKTSKVLHTKDPAKVNIKKFVKFIFAIPAGILIISRIPGASLPKNTA